MTEMRDRRERPMVLVVDDDMNTRLLVRESLEQAGFSVEEAEDGAQGLSVFKSLGPDIVLLDVVMPVMDGFNLCESLRRLPGGDRIPILMMTGLDDIKSINYAYEVGATDFVTKPINWTILGHRMRYILRTSLAADELRKSEAKNRAFINAIPDMLFRIRKDGTFLDYIAAKSENLAHHGKFLGKRLHEVFPELADYAMHHVDEALKTGDIQVFEYKLPHNENMRYYEGRVVASGEDEVLTIVRDFTERKRAEEHIHFLAYYDNLTSLPNRLFFKERLDHALVNASRYKKQLATLFIDLDRFKRINDTLGHSIGDKLLKSFADRLIGCLRKSDSVARSGANELASTVSRLGGDEFIILLTDINTIHDVARVAKRILNELSQPFTLDGYEVFITASIGVTIYPSDGEDVDTLLKNADTAMYHAKDQGRNNYQFYTQSMNATAFERLAMENSLRRAIERREFQLYYQPQLDINTGQIVGAEALIRWKHPDMGLVSPSDFIPLAEEAGLIIPIGEWALHTACAQSKALQAKGFAPVCAVNISSRQFRQENLTEMVAQALTDSKLDPQHLKLELTESTIMQNIDETIAILHRLKDMGIGIVIDDFGTGYSSLNYLKRFPLDALKIDRSFVKDITTDTDDANITKAIIAMSHSLNLKVIAEGVETEQQLAFLSENGCDEFQGYLFSRPLPEEDFVKLLADKGLTSGENASCGRKDRSFSFAKD